MLFCLNRAFDFYNNRFYTVADTGFDKKDTDYGKNDLFDCNSCCNGIYFLLFYTLGGNVEYRSYNFAEIVESYKSDDAPTAFSNEERFINEINENSTAYKYFSTGMFQQLSYTIITKYDEKNFDEKIAEIDEKYSFCGKTADDGEDCPFSSWGFDFRLIYSPDNSYPKQMRFIGINDTTKEIAYITFEDGEIDSVSDFQGLLAKSCGWMYIADERNYL